MNHLIRTMVEKCYTSATITIEGQKTIKLKINEMEMKMKRESINGGEAINKNCKLFLCEISFIQ